MAGGHSEGREIVRAVGFVQCQVGPLSLPPSAAQSKKFEESRSFVSFCHSRLSTRDFGARSLARRAIIGDFRFCCSAGLCMTYFALNGAEREVLEPAAVYGDRRLTDRPPKPPPPQRQHALIEFIR